MSCFTLEKVTLLESEWGKAYMNLASGMSSYEIDTGGSKRKVTRYDIAEVKSEWMTWLRRKCELEQTGKISSGIRVKYIKPIC
jgi:hypothetical protein